MSPPGSLRVLNALAVVCPRAWSSTPRVPKIESDIIHTSISRVERAINICIRARCPRLYAEGSSLPPRSRNRLDRSMHPPRDARRGCAIPPRASTFSYFFMYVHIYIHDRRTIVWLCYRPSPPLTRSRLARIKILATALVKPQRRQALSWAFSV